MRVLLYVLISGYTFSRYHLKLRHFSLRRRASLSDTSPKSTPGFCEAGEGGPFLWAVPLQPCLGLASCPPGTHGRSSSVCQPGRLDPVPEAQLWEGDQACFCPVPVLVAWPWASQMAELS